MLKRTTGIKRESNIIGAAKQSGSGSKDSIEYILDSPLRFGYLVAFCESEFNSENISFIMEVDRFRDLLLLDPFAWGKSWREVDMELKINGLDASFLWPSEVVSEANANGLASRICDFFLKPESSREICTSTTIRENTLERAKLVSLYGPEVFMEAIVDPIKTVRRDILPRFFQSALYQEMNTRLDSLLELPPASGLSAHPPRSSLIDYVPIEELVPYRKFTLSEVTECRLLYGQFLLFLEQRLCSENLLCVRIIDEFKEFFLDGNILAMTETAWKIYRYFVCSGSTFEVSIEYASRKQIMLGMARPTLAIFDDVRKSALAMLNSKFDSFCSDPEFENIPKMLREKKLEAKKRKGRLFSCFGF